MRLGATNHSLSHLHGNQKYLIFYIAIFNFFINTYVVCDQPGRGLTKRLKIEITQNTHIFTIMIENYDEITTVWKPERGCA